MWFDSRKFQCIKSHSTKINMTEAYSGESHETCQECPGHIFIVLCTKIKKAYFRTITFFLHCDIFITVKHFFSTLFLLLVMEKEISLLSIYYLINYFHYIFMCHSRIWCSAFHLYRLKIILKMNIFTLF